MAASYDHSLQRIANGEAYQIWEKPAPLDGSYAMLLIIYLARTPTEDELRDVFSLVANYLKIRDLPFSLMIELSRATWPGVLEMQSLLEVSLDFKKENQDLFERHAGCTTIVVPHSGLRNAINMAVGMGTAKPTEAHQSIEEALPFASAFGAHIPTRDELIANGFVLPSEEEIRRAMQSSMSEEDQMRLNRSMADFHRRA